jgi:hypothetical protein
VCKTKAEEFWPQNAKEWYAYQGERYLSTLIIFINKRSSKI